MNKWNLETVRRIAGIPLTEGWADDEYDEDDEDPDVAIANKDKGQSAFEKNNRKELKSASKEADAKAAAAKAKSETPAKDKTSEKKPETEKAPAKADPAKEEDKIKDASEAKKRGKAPNPDSKSGKMRDWLKANPNATRGEFIRHAGEHHQMSKHHANTHYYVLKKKMSVSECFILVHPASASFVLAENYELNRMQWIDVNSDLEPLIFETEQDAGKIAKYMAEWQGQQSVLQKVVID